MDELAQLDGLTNRLTITCPQLDAIHRAPPHWIRIAWGQGRLGLRHSRNSLSTFPQRRVINLGLTAASARSQNSGISANSLNLWSPISRNSRVLSAESTTVLRASNRSSINGCSYQ